MRILAAEDNPVLQTMLRSILAKWGYDAIIAHDGTEAWNVLRSPHAPPMAILDWMMPGVDGVEICRRVRAAGREPYTYILLLTARTQAEDLVEGMEAGADDYLTKPFNAHELRVRLRAGRRIVELQAELFRTSEALREQATHDALTGLLNRASVLAMLENELSRAGREQTHVGVLMVDLDEFKRINDTYGHLAGDAILHEAATRMKSAVRRYDTVGRYGGEEFLIVLPGCQMEDATAQAERVREAMAAAPFRYCETSLEVTCSIGVSWRAAPRVADTDSLIREADSALYGAKDGGRNRVVPWQPATASAGLPTLAMALRR